MPQDWQPNLTAGLSHLPKFQRDTITPEETCLVSLAPNRTRRWKMTLLYLRVEHSGEVGGGGELSASLQSQPVPKGSAGIPEAGSPQVLTGSCSR